MATVDSLQTGNPEVAAIVAAHNVAVAALPGGPRVDDYAARFLKAYAAIERASLQVGWRGRGAPADKSS